LKIESSHDKCKEEWALPDVSAKALFLDIHPDSEYNKHKGTGPVFSGQPLKRFEVIAALVRVPAVTSYLPE